mgnify:CR=1 FL=1
MTDALMAGYAAEDIVFVTPTWRGDYARFQLLRASMEAVGLGAVPHLAVVQTEDLDRFRGGAAGVTYRSTAEVLPPEVEQRRVRFLQRAPGRRSQTVLRSLYKRFGWFSDANYYGWHTQQLVKLGLARQLPNRVLITLDSDVIFTRPVPASVYARDGKVVLYERTQVLQRKLRRPGWYETACQLLDRPWSAAAGTSFQNYVTHPFVFDAGMLRRLLDHLERRYATDWWRALLAQPLGSWSEFMTYGVFVQQLQGGDGVFVEPGDQACRWLETAADRARARDFIREAFDDPAIRYLTIQADHHQRFTVDDYAPLVCAELSRRRLAD